MMRAEGLILARAAAKKILIFRKNPEIPIYSDNTLNNPKFLEGPKNPQKSSKNLRILKKPKNLKNRDFFSAAKFSNFSHNTIKI
jgi:hypothetical protein